MWGRGLVKTPRVRAPVLALAKDDLGRRKREGTSVGVQFLANVGEKKIVARE